MASRLNPYLNFNGNARQALEFYKSVFGGELTLSTFADMGMAEASDADKIMHGQLETEAGYTIMVADVPSHMEYQPAAGFSVSLSGDDGDALAGYFEKLADGGRHDAAGRSRSGATSSACASTSSASTGWSTSPSRRPDRGPAQPRAGLARRPLQAGRAPRGGRVLGC